MFDDKAGHFKMLRYTDFNSVTETAPSAAKPTHGLFYEKQKAALLTHHHLHAAGRHVLFGLALLGADVGADGVTGPGGVLALIVCLGTLPETLRVLLNILKQTGGHNHVGIPLMTFTAS